MAYYFPVGERGPSQRLQTRVVDKFIDIACRSDNPAATRGYTLAMGYLPAKLLAPNADVLGSVLECLHQMAHYDSVSGGQSNAKHAETLFCH